MKILIVAKVPTHPVRMGNSRLIVDQAEYLRTRGHDVHFLFVNERGLSDSSSSMDERIVRMKEFWGDRLHVHTVSRVRKLFLTLRQIYRKHINDYFIKVDDLYSSSIHKAINKLHRQYGFDCCIVNYYYLSKALKHVDIPRKALLTHDIFTYRARHCNERNIASLTPNEEAKAAQRAQYLLNVQLNDTSYYKVIAPDSKSLTTFANFNYTNTGVVGNANILFLSGASDLNYNGIKWFITDIFPLIRSKSPDAKLLVGGGICKMLTEFADIPGVELSGFVEDTEDFYNRGDFFINPIYQGTGLKIKTFEGLSFGKIVLTHPHSTEGIYNETSAPIFSSSNPDDWADYFYKLQGDKNGITDLKIEIKKYFDEFNSFIDSQYDILLNATE